MKTIAILRNPNVFKLWLSQVVSAIGDNFYDIAVIWIATQQIGAAGGAIVLVGSLSALAFGLFGGVYADRWNRRLTMAIVDFIRASVLIVLVILSATEQIELWHLVIVTAINVGLNALFQPTLIASLPVITKDATELQAANALMDVTARIARAVAPSIAGFLLATASTSVLFFADAMTFVISGLAVLSLSRRLRWQNPQPQKQSQNIRGDIQDAIRLVREHRVLAWALLTIVPVGSFIWGLAYIVGIPLFTERVLNGDAQTFGFIVAAYGVGNVISNIIIGNLVIRRRAVVMFAGSIVLGIGFVMLAIAQSLPFAMFAAFFASVGGPMEDVMLLLIIQDELPQEHTGKIYSLRMMISEIGYSLGLGGAALIYTIVSVPVGIAICGILFAVTGLSGLWRFGLAKRKSMIAS